MKVRLQALALLLTGCGSELVQPQEPFTCDIGHRALSLSHEQLAFDGEARIEVAGAEAGETVRFFWGTIGEPTCTCSDDIGGCIELDAPVALGSAVADDAGHATLTLTIPADALVGPRWLQASTGGTLSAMVQAEVSGKLGRALTEADAQYRVSGYGIARSVVGLGDLDGDGLSEIAAPAPAAGAVHLYAPTNGMRDDGPAPLVHQLGDTVTLLGPVGLGAAVAGVADVNFDDLDDVLISAPDHGAVWLVHGGLRPGEHDIEEVAAQALYDEAVGTDLASADLDGDHRPDLVIATDDQLLISFGSDLAVDDQIRDLANPRVAAVGDLDGDGLQDLAIASGDVVMMYYGPGILESGLEMPGAQVERVGDLNGDGYDDVQAASPTARDERGLVSVLHGPISPLLGVLEGSTSGERVGQAAAGAGDVDGDGLADLLAANADGTAVLLYGPAEGTRSTIDADILFASTSPERALGTALAGPGDLDGDHVDDMIVGATTRDGIGGLYVFRGAPGW